MSVIDESRLFGDKNEEKCNFVTVDILLTRTRQIMNEIVK